METHDLTPTDPSIPEEPPPAEGGESEIPDQPLGAPLEDGAGRAPLPGIPEKEPPSSG